MTTPPAYITTIRLPAAVRPKVEAEAEAAGLAPSAFLRRLALAGLGEPEDTPLTSPGRVDPRPKPPSMAEALTRTLVRDVGDLVWDLANRTEMPSDLLDRIRAAQADLVALVHHHRSGLA